MIYGKIWCVVKPSVGLPLFLGSVALASLIVHAAVLTNTTWYPRYLQGKPAVAAPAAAAESAAPPAAKK